VPAESRPLRRVDVGHALWRVPSSRWRTTPPLWLDDHVPGSARARRSPGHSRRPDRALLSLRMACGPAANTWSKTRHDLPHRVAAVFVPVVCVAASRCGRLAGRDTARSPSSRAQHPPSTVASTSATSSAGRTVLQELTTTNLIHPGRAVRNCVALDTAVPSMVSYLSSGNRWSA
jgi:hypothetical protein